MKKIFQLTSLLVLGVALVLSCAKEEITTDQFDSAAVVLKAYGPQPVVRGGVLRFVGSNLDKVATVTIPGVSPIEPEVVTAGVHSEIRVTVPKEGPEVGFPVLTLQDGSTITPKTMITYSESILIDSFTPASAYPGETVTITGDYLNLIHEAIFAEKVLVSEEEFIEHTRYKVVVKVPPMAQTGKIGLGTLDELNTEDEDILATLNIIETETALTVGTAKGTVTATPVKAGETVEINGDHMLLVRKVVFEGVTENSFAASDSKLTLPLSELAQDGVVKLVMASGVEVEAGTLTTVKPVVSGVTPSPVKNGAAITIVGSDLDLVKDISFPNAGSVNYAVIDGKISVDVPEKAQEGDIVLSLANGTSVTAELVLVQPTVTGFSANPASAGSDVTIEGTDLDLVAGVAFFLGQEEGEDVYSDPIEVAATETSITVAVPTAAIKGKVKLILKNKAEILTEDELDVDKPVAAYLVSVPEDVFKVGDLFLADIENAEHLLQVLFDEIEVQFVVNNGKLYATVPAGVKKGTILHLVSDNGTLDYPVNIDPGDRIITTIWTGQSTVTWGGGAVTALSWGGYDWSTVKAGLYLKAVYTIDDPGGCIRFGNGSWASLPSLAGLAPDGNLPLQEGGHAVLLTQEDVEYLATTGGLVICGTGYTITEIQLVELIPQETIIWTGPSTVTWGGGAVTALSWGGYDWSTVVAGSAIAAHYTIDDPAGCIRFGNGSWASLPSLAGLAADGNLPLQEGGHTVVLTQEDVEYLATTGGLVLCGTGYTIASIGLLVMPEI